MAGDRPRATAGPCWRQLANTGEHPQLTFAADADVARPFVIQRHVAAAHPRPGIRHRRSQRTARQPRPGCGPRVHLPHPRKGPPQGHLRPLADPLGKELRIRHPDELSVRDGDLRARPEHPAEGLPAHRRRHVERARDAPLGRVQRERGQVPHIHRLNRPVRCPRGQHPATRGNPPQPPRQPPHVLARPQHHPRPQGGPPACAERLCDRQLAPRLLVAVPRRPVFDILAVVRPRVRRAVQHLRVLRQRLDRPAPVHTHRGHEHTTAQPTNLVPPSTSRRIPELPAQPETARPSVVNRRSNATSEPALQTSPAAMSPSTDLSGTHSGRATSASSTGSPTRCEPRPTNTTCSQSTVSGIGRNVIRCSTLPGRYPAVSSAWRPAASAASSPSSTRPPGSSHPNASATTLYRRTNSTRLCSSTSANSAIWWSRTTGSQTRSPPGSSTSTCPSHSSGV